jgi:hypothetical protein
LILDYKTGEAGDPPGKTHRGRDGWKDLQLPLYRHLAAQITDSDGLPLIPETELGRLAFGYVLLSRDLQAVGAQTVFWSSEELEEADECARDVVRFLREGRARFSGEQSSRWPNDPLAPLLGARLLADVPEDEIETEEEATS